MASEGEINRLRELPEDYDVELFNSYYKGMTPLIRKLSKNIDCRRFNVSKDIIQSYFYDKLLYVFTKYYHLATENPEKFKATILSSLTMFRSRLLKNAYSKKSIDFNASITSFEDCFEDSKRDDIPELDEEEARKNEKLEELYDFMRIHLSKDAYLLFQIQVSPPLYFLEQNHSINSKITTAQILDFFELPKTKLFIKYIVELRSEISQALSLAKDQLG